MSLMSREHPKIVFCSCFRRSPGSNLRPLVYKASDLSTAPRRLQMPLQRCQFCHKAALSFRRGNKFVRTVNEHTSHLSMHVLCR